VKLKPQENLIALGWGGVCDCALSGTISKNRRRFFFLVSPRPTDWKMVNLAQGRLGRGLAGAMGSLPGRLGRGHWGFKKWFSRKGLPSIGNTGQKN